MNSPDQKPAPSVWDVYADKLTQHSYQLLHGRSGSLAKSLREFATELQMLRAKCHMPPLAVEDGPQRLARWLREYPLTPGATATAPAAPKAAPVSATPTWDQYAKITDPLERTRFWNANTAALNAESKIALKKGGGK